MDGELLQLDRDVREMKGQQRWERERQDLIMANILQRLTVLESRPPASVLAQSDRHLIFGTLLKVLIALAIPLSVLMLTGDLKQAIAAAKLSGGG